MTKIALDAGHGFFTAGKRSPDDEREWSFNNKVLLACVTKLNTYENVQILRLDDPTGKTDVPLITRTNNANAWKADVLVSIHHNALAGKWHSSGGIETFVQEKSASKASIDIANAIQTRIVKAMELRDRGVKTSNLHMTRQSTCPTILTEGGFFDSTVDILSLRDDSKLRRQGEAIAEGLAEYFKLKPKVQIATITPQPTALITPVQPTPTQQPKEGIRMFNPSTQVLKRETIEFLEKARKEGVFSSLDWEKKAKNDELPIDDLIGLLAAFLSRTIK